ncbi:unnamed protein product [Litomosoides sigmodontis]|uniref:Uncharacterized protein n=1 Tax=Litomosoides sigmodontis TaxID=42156 RepID=A0A3P6TQ58_LITSI|nr:unnamed protein product [Litomosoides sigmodontis]
MIAALLEHKPPPQQQNTSPERIKRKHAKRKHEAAARACLAWMTSTRAAVQCYVAAASLLLQRSTDTTRATAPTLIPLGHATMNSANFPKATAAKDSSIDESGIRTHAPEETGALNQRLRPLGHLAPTKASPIVCYTTHHRVDVM